MGCKMNVKHGNYGFVFKKRPIPKLTKLFKNRCTPKGFLQKQKYHIDEEFVRTLQSLERGEHQLSARNIKFLRSGTRSDFTYNGSFHEAVGAVLVMAQCFGLMPVRGVKAKDVKGLLFTWYSFRTLFCLLYVVISVVDTLLTMRMVFSSMVDIQKLESVIFHISILMATVEFFRLAQKWPRLMRRWEKVEKELPPYRGAKQKGELGTQIKMITFVTMMLSLMEHLLSTISAIHFANYCPARTDPIESYFVSVVSQVFFTFEYSHWLAWMGKIENVLMTFAWTYMDTFVMIMGIGLSSMFRQVQRNLEKYQGQQMPECFWEESRMQYRSICLLIEEVDDAITSITVLSFANNLYFVCIQLLKSINKMPSIAHGVYFYFSLVFLLGRTLAVSLYSAELNDRSKDPLIVLKCVPKESWCSEVERFADEVSNDVVALTGMKFFSITRKLVLTIAGTIITYELVLIQFHEDRQPIFNCGE